jgi:hypothetical protein
MLPKGTLRHAKYGEVAYVAYARFKKGDVSASPLDGKPFGTRNDSLTFITGCFESSGLMVLHRPVGSGSLSATRGRDWSGDCRERHIEPEKVLDGGKEILRLFNHGCVSAMFDHS